MASFFAFFGALSTIAVLVSSAIFLRRLGFDGGAALIGVCAVAGVGLALAGVLLTTF